MSNEIISVAGKHMPMIAMDEFITMVGEFADIFWGKAVEKILCVLETGE